MIFAAFAIAAISLALTKASVSQPIREWVADYPMLAKLFSCPFCMSFWVSAVVAIFVHERFCGWLPADYVISLFAMMGMAAVASGWIFQNMMAPQDEIDDLRAMLVEARDSLHDVLNGSREGRDHA